MIFELNVKYGQMIEPIDMEFIELGLPFIPG